MLQLEELMHKRIIFIDGAWQAMVPLHHQQHLLYVMHVAHGSNCDTVDHSGCWSLHTTVLSALHNSPCSAPRMHNMRHAGLQALHGAELCLVQAQWAP